VGAGEQVTVDDSRTLSLSASKDSRLERWKNEMREADKESEKLGKKPVFQDLLHSSAESLDSTELVAPDVDTPYFSDVEQMENVGRRDIPVPILKNRKDKRRTHSTPLDFRVKNAERHEVVKEENADERSIRLRLAAATPTKFEEGGVWRYFLADFRETVRMSGLRSSDQLGFLKRALPDKAIRLLHQYGVETLDDAIHMLTSLYEPQQDSCTAMQAIGGIVQDVGERLTGLAGRIKEVVRRYADTMDLRKTDVDKMVIDRFKHAIADKDTRNFLQWDPSPMTLAGMVEKAQRFQDCREQERTPERKKNFRVAGQSPERLRMQNELDGLKRQLEMMMAEKDLQTVAVKGVGRGKERLPFSCWNCGKRGHYSRDCKESKVGNGFSQRTSVYRGGGKGTSGDVSKPLNL
jgi:hypothetical protein